MSAYDVPSSPAQSPSPTLSHDVSGFSFPLNGQPNSLPDTSAGSVAPHNTIVNKPSIEMLGRVSFFTLLHPVQGNQAAIGRHCPDAPLGLARAPWHTTWECFARLALTHLAIVHAVSPSAPTTALLPTLHCLLSPPSSLAVAAGPPNLQLVLVQVIGGACNASAAHAYTATLNATATTAGGPVLRIVTECAPLSVVRQ
ncbi:hypothetical protein BKA93DRAFT_822792 [Sparassis latifolia]